MGQRGPQKAGEFARHGGDNQLFRFPARGEHAVATMQMTLRVPGDLDRGVRRAALALLQRGSEKGVMTVLPRGFDEHAAERGIPRFGDRAACLFAAAGML